LALGEKSRDFTTFAARDQCHRYRVQPMGQRPHRRCFTTPCWEFVTNDPKTARAFLFVDDLLIMSGTEEQHKENVRTFWSAW